MTSGHRPPPPTPPAGSPQGPAGYLADDAPPPAGVRLQLGALQSLCRQTVAVRLAMVVVGAPFALAHTSHGAPRYAVLAAAVLCVMTSYALLRDWERIGPRLLAHPALMALDLLLGATLLLTASPASPLAYATVCTPLLSGLLYGWRGAGVLTGLQLAVVLTGFRAWEHRPGAGTSTLLVAGFCAAAGVIGVTLRNLLFRFGTASEALAQAHARLAANAAVEDERVRLAREMHDSVAKTLHGLALAADALAASDGDSDPETVRRQSALVAGAARRAAAQCRELLGDLRHPARTAPARLDLCTELDSLTSEFATRTGIATELARPRTPLLLSRRAAHSVLAIVAEALENTHRHARATRVRLELGTVGGAVGDTSGDVSLTLGIDDDGAGLPPDTAPERLATSGHFGLLGMVERATSLGGGLSLGRSPLGGARILLRMPLPATAPHTPQEEAAHA
ncbi:histidine kinase [Streptomyces sp. NPDC048664]|uniref:sensor histidine kinase n=1 Tax=Streptomyces sp. NPDC048664 TaxID=3154505 RepID=UPI00342562A5